jgi:hypothetical protein
MAKPKKELPETPARRFKVLAESINIYSILEGKAVVLERNTTEDVENFDPNTLIVLSGNGLSDAQGNEVYKASIEFLDGQAPAAEGEKLDVASELEKQGKVN